MPPTIPTSIDDPVNEAILTVAEDRLQGFQPRPFHAIAELCGHPLGTVLERLGAMLEAGNIRRIRQTLHATGLAPGALVAWRVPPKQLNSAFAFMSEQDPFSGHVVLRTTDTQTPGSAYRLWTTLKVPVGYSMAKHADALLAKTGAERYKLLPAKKLFALGVGHVRRRGLEPGSRTDEPGRVLDTEVIPLSALQWKVIAALKREFAIEEIVESPWAKRAEQAGLSLEQFEDEARKLESMKLIGRFSAFLEHVKRHDDGQRVTRFNALFHWKVPAGKELDAGREVGRHHCMTHAYWREGGDEFNGVNIMGVSHGTEKDAVLAHKAAIDQHLQDAGIDVSYTNVFWGGKSEIKPSEVLPQAYAAWCTEQGLDPQAMRA